MSFAKRLKQLRKELSITQEELALKLAKTRSTIAGYETERKEPDYETLRSIANFFDVSIDFLLGNTDVRNPYKNEKDMPTKAYHKLDKSGLSEEDIQKVEEYIELLKQKYNPDGSLKGK